jgi:peptidoglycan/xylan/chitin deacetylase (PgdA/CDA1 family)
MLLDDDMLCPRNLISGHVAAHERMPGVLVFGPIFVAGESERSVAVNWLTLHGDRNTVGSNASPQTKYRAWATNCSVRRSALIAQGGYDQTLLTHEDADLGIRLWEAGVRFQFEPSLAIYELYDKTPRRLASVESGRLGRNEVLLCRKHPGYRSYSRQAHLRDRTLGSLFIWLACRFPVSPEPLLRPFQFLAEHLHTTRGEAQAMQFFRCRLALEEVRGTHKESGSWRVFHEEFGLKLPVLRYGRRPGKDPFDTQGFWVDFESQVRSLKRRGYAGIRPSQWLEWVREGKRLPARPVMITFDDAGSGVGDHAVPILRRHGFGAAVFVSGTSLSAAEARQTDQSPGASRSMSADEMRRCARGGIEFGVRPPDLAYSSAAAMEQEVLAGKHEVEDLIQSRVASFAYPNGLYSDNMRRWVEPAFDIAFTAEPGLNVLGTDLFRLRGSAICAGDSWFDRMCLLRFGWRPAQYLRTLRAGRGSWAKLKGGPILS